MMSAPDDGDVAQRPLEDRFLGGFCAIELADDRSAVHHGDPVAHAEDLGQLGRDHQDRQPAAGQLAHEPVDLGLGADIHTLGRLVQDQDLRAKRPASGRVRLSAGCRRRGCPRAFRARRS